MVLFTTEIKCCRCLPEASGVGNSLRKCPHDLVLLLRCKGIQRAPSFFTTTIPPLFPSPSLIYSLSIYALPSTPAILASSTPVLYSTCHSRTPTFVSISCCLRGDPYS